MLWFSTSGRASKMVSSEAASPRQSEISTSTVVVGVAIPDGADRRRHGTGAPVRQVVAGHARHDGVPEPHALDRLGHTVGLVGRQRQRVAGVDLAEAAGPGAALAVDHEGRRAVGPALVDVRAPASSHTVTRPRSCTVGPERAVALADAHRHPHPRRLARLEVQPVLGRHPGLAEAAQQRPLHVRLTGARRRALARTSGPLDARRRPKTAAARATKASSHLRPCRRRYPRPAARSRRGRRCRTGRCGRTWPGRR